MSTKPKWPSPHEFTNSVLHELVLVQLLNPVQSHRLNHFFARPSRIFFFFTCGPILLTQLPHSKKYSHLPYSSTYVKGFFFLKTLFLFCYHCHACRKLKEHGHRPLLPSMFKEEQGVAATWRFKQHEVQHLQEDTKTRYVFYIFFCT
jgi:hypothetical protein